MNEDELELLEKALAESAGAMDRLEKAMIFWKKPSNLYVVAKDWAIENQPIFDLARAVFYCKSQNGQRGWTVCLSDATLLSRSEANDISECFGGAVFDYEQTQKFFDEYYQEQVEHHRELANLKN